MFFWPLDVFRPAGANNALDLRPQDLVAALTRIQEGLAFWPQDLVLRPQELLPPCAWDAAEEEEED